MQISNISEDENGVIIDIEQYPDMNKILITNSGVVSAVIKADCPERRAIARTEVFTHTYSTMMGSRSEIYDVVARHVVRTFSPQKSALVMIGVKSMDGKAILPHITSIKRLGERLHGTDGTK